MAIVAIQWQNEEFYPSNLNGQIVCESSIL